MAHVASNFVQQVKDLDKLFMSSGNLELKRDWEEILLKVEETEEWIPFIQNLHTSFVKKKAT